MSRRPPVSSRLLLAGLLVAAALAIDAAPAFAQAGPFGVGAPEAGAGAPAGAVFNWIAARQNEFYRALTAGLRAMRADPHAGWWLVLLSFGYGVFHAAGPGHGKAVITSYVLADGETLRRGIALAFVSALVQGIVAIVFVGAAVTLLHLTAVEMTDATMVFERTSATAILALGLWLAWTKIVAPLVRRPAPPADTEEVIEVSIGGPPPAAPAASTAFRSDACGCAVHAADPATLRGPFDWKRALAAVAAVGIRPCTGALIVLVFAFAQGLVAAGIAAVLAMAVGTGTTVAVLATIAVAARGLALRVAGDDDAWTLRVMRGAEIGGAVIVLVMGVLLTGASFAGVASGG